jgi:hypothetical protein
LGCYAAQIYSYLLTFLGNLSVTSSRVKLSFLWTAGLLKLDPKGCTETSATDYQPTLHNIPEDRRYHGIRLLVQTRKYEHYANAQQCNSTYVRFLLSPFKLFEQYIPAIMKTKLMPCSYTRVPQDSHWRESIEVTSENPQLTADTIEKSRAAKISNEIFELYGTQKFITVFTKTRYSTSCTLIVYFSFEMGS